MKEEVEDGGIASEETGVSEFKKHCLRLFEVLRRQGKESVITKRGVPIARVVPVRSEEEGPLQRILEGKIEIAGEIVETDWSEDWEANR